MTFGSGSWISLPCGQMVLGLVQKGSMPLDRRKLEGNYLFQQHPVPVLDLLQEGMVHLVPSFLCLDKQAEVAQILSAGTAVERSRRGYLLSSASVPCFGSLWGHTCACTTSRERTAWGWEEGGQSMGLLLAR